ncbi:MAG TPA: 3-phosphoshikimate 1-carboxyvinyltransferase [Pseudonocardiaceae bacterium]|nr:3-phosphoshikimate 1-carboxyvinyltransferase [Pseudonocardiaceae bacterium]
MHLLVNETVNPLKGQFVVPPSKYHAHRALILAALADGTSQIHGLSDAGHVHHTIRALRKLGTEIDTDGDVFTVRGGPFRPRGPVVSVGSSGTTLYFLTGLASLAETPVTVVGQRYFQRRPIGPLLKALSGMGVRLSASDDRPPISVQPHRPTGGEVSIPGTLSQWISGLLLLAPFATGPTVVRVEGELNERTYVELTIDMMRQFGLRVHADDDWRQFEIEPYQRARPATVTLPPDVGAAAFGLAAAALHPCDVTFDGLSTLSAAETDHPEAELLDIVARMGLPMERDGSRIRVRHDGIGLAPVELDCRDIPDLLPVLSVLATFADGVSTFDNVGHVRLKESDRVSAMLQLNRMGGHLELANDRLTCHGVTDLRGTRLSSYNDHRVLMALAIAASRARGCSRLTYPTAYRISYPRFLAEMNGVGTNMSVVAGPVRPRRAPTTIDQRVRRWAGERSDETAVVVVPDGRSWTWRELDEQADRLAMRLLDLDVRPGEAVAYQLPNWGEFAVVTLAILRAGAVCCPLMPIFREREMVGMLSRSKARVLFVPDHFRGRSYRAEAANLNVEHVIVVGEAELADQVVDRAALAARAPSPTGLAQLLFTSGTSGEPKGVLHRMDALTRAAAAQAAHLGLNENDRIFVPSPLAHQTGFLYGMWLSFYLGVPQILQPVWNGEVALAALRDHRGTFVQAATPFLADLTAAAASRAEPTDLRIFVATGTTVPRALAEAATSTLGAAVCGAWGSTESCLGSLGTPADPPETAWGSDGRALPGVSLRVTDDNGAILPPGQEGNFEVMSECLFEGYLDHPEWTKEALSADGWYRTGDLATIDTGGYVRITGRVKDVINRGGEKIPVTEIEQLLHTHPLVHDVAIVAMPDERLGERACAFVEAEPGLDLDGMKQFLDDQKVAKQYWPERLEVIAALPRNPVGKIKKAELRNLVRSER